MTENEYNKKIEFSIPDFIKKDEWVHVFIRSDGINTKTYVNDELVDVKENTFKEKP